MSTERRTEFTQAARDIASLLQSRGIKGGNASRAFQRAIKDQLFRERWTQLWCRTANSFGGEMGLTSTVDVLKKAARLAGIDEGWDGIGTLTSDAVTRLLEARAFNGFLDWIPGACTQAPEKRRKAAPRTRAAKAA